MKHEIEVRNQQKEGAEIPEIKMRGFSIQQKMEQIM